MEPKLSNKKFVPKFVQLKTKFFSSPTKTDFTFGLNNAQGYRRKLLYPKKKEAHVATLPLYSKDIIG